ncbi:hypothetical protein RKE29_27925 [Streptomyces sp. B1866]|uniref:hypothetical protein n=1 Tax=Streptomyces sp. B1866 TaxID=3075431 RepID=UPI0028903967|nr:hypothetical protein [Streptomyces sp. B1866]MDT3400392.1 hypothetical protein [Streptomyces sp. B1866]
MREAGLNTIGSRTTAQHPPSQPARPVRPAPTSQLGLDGPDGADDGPGGQGGQDGPPAQDCDLVTVPARQGLEAVAILRLRDGVGPVLHDGACDTLGFLVPPGTADAWDLPGSACTQTYAGAGVCAGGGRGGRGPADPPVSGTGWLVPPDATPAVATDPADLRAALGEAARTIEAADRCQ